MSTRGLVGLVLVILGACTNAESVTRDAGELDATTDASGDAAADAATDSGGSGTGGESADGGTGGTGGTRACTGFESTADVLIYDVTRDRIFANAQTVLVGTVTALGDAPMPEPAQSAFIAAGEDVDGVRWLRIVSRAGADWIVATRGLPLSFGSTLGSLVTARLSHNPSRAPRSASSRTVEIDVGDQHAFYFRRGYVNEGMEITSGVSNVRGDEVCRRSAEACSDTSIKRYKLQLTIDGAEATLGEHASAPIGAYDAWHGETEFNLEGCPSAYANESTVAFAHRAPLFETPGQHCELSTYSSLEFVHIEIDSDNCTWTRTEAAAGIAFDYRTTVESTLVNINPAAPAQYTCAVPEASGLMVATSIDGSDQHYCVCDQGLCPAPPPAPTILLEGIYPTALSWHGRNWNGPSDTATAEGSAFPAGTYVVQAKALGVYGSGTGPIFEVSRTLAFALE